MQTRRTENIRGKYAIKPALINDSNQNSADVPPVIRAARQQMAAHESARTTKLYDRRNDQVTLDEVERIVL